jgi:hypothetical protein
MGLTLHEATKSAGIITGESATSVTVAGVDFVALLGTPTDPGAPPLLTYVLELDDGTIQEITSWTAGGVLNTPSDITSKVTPGTTTYKLRKAATISSIFGAANSLGLAPSSDGDPAAADKILIPNASNAFDTVFYYNDGAGTEGWLDDGGNLAADKVLLYPDGMYVQRVAGPPINLVVSGEVKTKPTGGVLGAGYNYLNAVVPTGVTLDQSGLKAYISHSSDGSPESADNVLIQTPGGTYTTCFYYNDGAGVEGWLDDGSNLAGEYVLDGGFLIYNRAGIKPYTVAVPAAYGSL